MSGLTASQSAYEATLIQQSTTLFGALQAEGTQVPAEVPPGASSAQAQAIGLEAQVAGTLDASIGGAATPPPEPLTAPGTNQYQASTASETLSNDLTLAGSLGLGTNTNTLA
jgi:hypothetical protein